jgi:hypothetical protein
MAPIVVMEGTDPSAAEMAEEQPQPITPHAGPTLDSEGQLTYVGADGRRYVVGLPHDADRDGDGDGIEQVMGDLRDGHELLERIEALCHQWIETVHSWDLDRRAALVLLLTTLETNLENTDPDPD